MFLQLNIPFNMSDQLQKRITNFVYFMIVKDALIDEPQSHSCVYLFRLCFLEDCHTHVGLFRIVEVEKVMECHIVVRGEINWQVNRCLYALFDLFY